jgi:hypothetical protein
MLVPCQISFPCLANYRPYSPTFFLCDQQIRCTKSSMNLMFNSLHFSCSKPRGCPRRLDPNIARTEELRELERGSNTCGADEPVTNSLIGMKSSRKGSFDFDSAGDHACKRLGIQKRFWSQNNCYSPTQRQRFRLMSYMQGTLTHMKIGQLQSCRDYWVHFAQMTEEERMRFNHSRHPAALDGLLGEGTQQSISQEHLCERRRTVKHAG